MTDQDYDEDDKKYISYVEKNWIGLLVKELPLTVKVPENEAFDISTAFVSIPYSFTRPDGKVKHAEINKTIKQMREDGFDVEFKLKQ